MAAGGEADVVIEKDSASDAEDKTVAAEIAMADKLAQSPEGRKALEEAHAEAVNDKEQEKLDVEAAKVKAQQEKVDIEAAKVKAQTLAAAKAAARAQREAGQNAGKTGTVAAYGGKPLFQPPGDSKQGVLPVPPAAPSEMGANGAPMPQTPHGFPPTPAFTEIGGQYQNIGQGGTGSQNQQNGPTANGNSMMNLAGYNEAMMREKAAANVAAGPSLEMSVKTCVVHADGVTIIDTGLLPGDDGSVALSSEVMIQIDHFKVHKLWQSWLRKYALTFTQQVGVACTVDGLGRLRVSAQRSENQIFVSLSTGNSLSKPSTVLAAPTC